jgi:predicted DNA-binding ribbon-helix-helix protein
MAVAKHNQRFLVTLEKDFLEIVKREAGKRGVSASKLIADIVENHFREARLYNPEDAEWKRKQDRAA